MRRFRVTRPIILMLAGMGFGLASPAQASEATPSDVYAAVDQINRSLEVILTARDLPVPAVRKTQETGLGPFHVYQFHLACIERLHRYQRSADLRPVPLVTSVPMAYKPADVMKLSNLLLNELQEVAQALDIDGLPESAKSFSEKTPTDVIEHLGATFSRLRVLNGEAAITPNEVYAESVRAVTDARSILSQIDPACRYRINVTASDRNLKPSDVFAKILVVRRGINEIRDSLGLGTTPVPSTSSNQQLNPDDVFFQTQVLIAELNLIKMGTGTFSVTALAIPTFGKTPSDVHEQVSLLEFLLDQMNPLRELVAKTSR